MFEVKVFVEEKKLAQLLWSFDGVVVGAPQITPVRGAVVKTERSSRKPQTKHLAPVTTKGENLPSKLAVRILECEQTLLRRVDLTKMVEELGYKKGSMDYAEKSLIKSGLLKPVGKAQFSINRGA